MKARWNRSSSGIPCRTIGRVSRTSADGPCCSTARSRSPASRYWFGVDALLGLVPGLGNLTTPAFTVLLLVTGVRMRVPVVVLARMVMNAAFDAVVGLVPVAGDLVDIGWKANLRNLDLLERHAVPGMPASRADVWFVAAGVALIALVGVVALIPIAIVVYALQNLRRRWQEARAPR